MTMETVKGSGKKASGGVLDVLGKSPAANLPLPPFAALPVPFSGVGSRVESLYVHVPFCSSKCHYCDFYSFAGHMDQADNFLNAMEREADLQEEGWGKLVPETIFIGGGTPTLLSAERLQRLLGIIDRHIDKRRLVEFTVEGNPNTFDAERAAVLFAGGVNRLSFGAQSFHKSELATLQRDHDPENVAKAFAIARAAGFANLNVDLIFGIPGQTLATWEESLRQALALEPTHMSCYSLTYEPTTAMTARLRRGEFAEIDEELELEMFEHVYARMRGAGFGRYEVSNYAREGKECRHNLNYWKGANWGAWGPSAAGHVDGWRWKNVGSLAHYVEALLEGEGSVKVKKSKGVKGWEGVMPLTQVEHLSKEAWAGEVAAFWLRLSEGLDYAEFLERTGVEARGVLERVLGVYVGMGLVELTAERARICEKGVVVSNRILREVVGAF